MQMYTIVENANFMTPLFHRYFEVVSEHQNQENYIA